MFKITILGKFSQKSKKKNYFFKHRNKGGDIDGMKINENVLNELYGH